VARDRQRAKQRRRRATGSAGKPAQSKARDIGLDDPSVEEAGIGDAVPAPDPLKNASPDADMARAATTGEPPIEDDEPYSDDFERAPDQLDPAIQEDRHPAAAGRKDRGRALTFLRHCVDELRRVQWPDRKHVFQATAVVLGFVLIAGGWLGLMDAIWQPVVNAIL
jgi:preprotein translocase SecE subunit